MGEDGNAGRGYNPVLRFFGMHNGKEATETLTWVAPYIGMFLCALLGMSLLIQQVFPLPVWVHVVAVLVAGGNCFLFLAWIRQSSLEEHDVDNDDTTGTIVRSTIKEVEWLDV